MAMARLALRLRREQLDLSQEQVALEVGISTTAYRDWESGVSAPRVGRRTKLAKAMGWSLAQLAEALDGVSPNGHAVPGWLGHLASLEQAAAEIRAFEPVVVHGLLQAKAYATAVESINALNDRHVVEKVRVRLARQAVLARKPDPLRLWVVLDASVLLRVAGSAETMAEQLDHLVKVAQRPNVTLQVMPLSSAVFPAAFGAFSLLTSRDADEPYMACVEDSTGPHYLDRPPDINAHVNVFEHLASTALTPTESVEFITATKENHP